LAGSFVEAGKRFDAGAGVETPFEAAGAASVVHRSFASLRMTGRIRPVNFPVITLALRSGIRFGVADGRFGLRVID
jgi:hypothetical protein